MVKRWSNISWLVFFAALALLPLAVPIPYYLHLVITIAIYAIVLLGMDLLVGYTGQVSLGHAAFFGIGAYTCGLLMMKAQIPFSIALVASMVVAAAFGLLLSTAALRVTGPYLAMVTLAFGTIVQILINEMSWLTMGPVGLPVNKPSVGAHKLTTFWYYYIVIWVLLLTVVCASRWATSYLGRAFEALRDSPIATECMGISVTRYKSYAFSISAAMAGLGGALYAVSEEYTSPNTYSFELSILFLLGVIFGGRKSRAGAMIGATVVVMLPTLLDSITTFRWLAACAVWIALMLALYRARNTGVRSALSALPPIVATAGLLIFSFYVENLNEHRLTVFGLLILLVVFYLPDGVMGIVRWVHPVSAQNSLASRVESPTRDVLSRPKPLALQIQNITMRFGGLTALNDVSIHIAPGSIHGLIGPNGSGKSTMMNVLTGVYVPTAGEVKLDSIDIHGKHPSAIATAGIARTFQNVQLFWEVTALENVMVGLHREFSTGLLSLALNTSKSRSHELNAQQHAMALLNLVGLGDAAHIYARDLAYGKQRLLEIARALALSPSVLLLDEPAAGLTAPDIAALTAVLRVIKSHGLTIVLIEHHVDMVMKLCDKVTVLDFGEKIAEGLAVDVRNNPKVIAAYLGASA
jgi:branched-chain amino acid transport system permease protein